MLRPWYRIADGSEGENPGIENYVGRGDATLVYSRNGHEFSLAARHSLRGGDDSRGAVQFDWGFPLTRNMRGHPQAFDGYGESMMDYTHRSTQIGLGVSLLDWFCHGGTRVAATTHTYRRSACLGKGVGVW